MDFKDEMLEEQKAKNQALIIEIERIGNDLEERNELYQ